MSIERRWKTMWVVGLIFSLAPGLFLLGPGGFLRGQAPVVKKGTAPAKGTPAKEPAKEKEVKKEVKEEKPEGAEPATPEGGEGKEAAGTNPNSLLAQQAQLPRLEDVKLPSAASLLKGPDIDWVVLTTDRVLVVEPVRPRPGTLKFLEDEHVRLHKLPLPKKADDPQGYADLFKKRAEARLLPVSLVEGDERDFFIHMKFIKEIVYCEDMMLKRVDLLLDEKKPGEAYELLEAVLTRNRNWPGLDARQERLLLVEAQVREKAGRLEDALAYLEQLHKRSPKYEGLVDLLARVSETLIQEAVKEQDYRRARFFLGRFSRLEPKHPTVLAIQRGFSDQGAKLLAQALEADQQHRPGEAIRFAELANRIWPQTPNLTHESTRLQQQHQIIRIGVLQFPEFDNVPYLVDSPAVQRIRPLMQVRLFSEEGVDGVTLRYRSRIFEEWEPTDLGHSLTFRVKNYRSPWESLPEINDVPIVNQLRDRMDPKHPAYDERLANAVKSITFLSPWEFELDFRQVPLRPEGYFAFPLQLDRKAAPVDWICGKQGMRFTVEKEVGKEIRYRRVKPEPASADKHVAEIVEIQHESPEKAVQALLRGEILMLLNARARDLPLLAERADVLLRPIQMPVSHVLQFHPRSVIAPNRALRRALSVSIDRQEILDKFILEGEKSKYGRVSTAPFPTTHPGYNSQVAGQERDLRLALTLGVAAKKEAGGAIPELKLACAPDPNLDRAVQEMIRQWGQVGLKVVLVPWKEVNQASLTAEKPAWDMVLRAERMPDPLVQLWPYLILDRRARIEPLQAMPNWLRQKVLEMDLAVDDETALSRLKDLHEHLWAETYLVPLWELDEYIVHRKNLRELPEVPMAVYQNVEKWRVISSFSQEGL